MRKPRIVLVSGIPASGKSTYCKWLKDEKGWFHCDLDQLLASKPITLQSLVQEADARTVPTVVDWGFPPAQISLVESLKSLGVEIWWFDGDRTAAAESFVHRNKSGKHPATLQDLTTQLSAIEANWSKIMEVFGSSIITSVQDGPQYLEPESIFQAMLRP